MNLHSAATLSAQLVVWLCKSLTCRYGYSISSTLITCSNMNEKPINFDIEGNYSNKEYQAKDIQRYLVEGGDIGFNPNRNKHIVEETLKHNLKIHNARIKAYRDELGERADATISYMNYLNKPNKSRSAEAYFGKRELARLKGIEFARSQQNITKFFKDDIIIASK